MGKIRIRKVKVLAAEILERYPDTVKTEFGENKKFVEELLRGAVSKRLRNKVSGYLTSLAKQKLRKEAAEKEEPLADVNA
jgi:small subunit ribosomal protein S17e